jgi:methionine-gamma-lyase
MAKPHSFRRTRIGSRTLHPSTQMMSYGYEPAMSEGAVKPPVFLTSTFAFKSAEEGAEFFDVVAGRKPSPQDGGAGGLVYSRFNHPNTEIVEDRLALIDGAEGALLTASGMAAISAVFLSLTRPGDAIVHYTPLYGGTETLLGKVLTGWGIKPIPFSDGLEESALIHALEKAARHGPVKLLFLETPANPTNAMTDLAMARSVVDRWAKATGQKPAIVCDNTMLGPVFQKPIALGTDICVYSLTKYVGGHSDLIAGGITGRTEYLKAIRQTRSAFGFQLDPHSSWMLARSLETLTLRMERAADTASRVADWLANNTILPCRVLHPEHAEDAVQKRVYRNQCSGPGSTFSFVVDNNRALAFRVLNQLQLFKLAVSLGGTESLVCHPASTTHSGVPRESREDVGVTEGLIRISVGLEHPDDLIEDLKQAFRKASFGGLPLSA